MVFLFIILAAIASACADRVETTIHFNASIFSHLNPKWWSKVGAADIKKIPFTNYPPNFWHLCKSTMICSLLATPFFYHILIHPIVDYVIFGVVYNVVFEQFYSHILKS